MPIYDFECEDCKAIFEEIRPSIYRDAHADCPYCDGGNTRRVIVKVAIPVYKGDGFTKQTKAE